MRSAFGLLLILVFAWVPAWSSAIFYSDGGTFTASTPPSEISAPSETWSFSFEADSMPVVTESGMGGFDFDFSDFVYDLDGSPVSITPSFVRFFTASNGGGFEICFDGSSVATCSEAIATAFFADPALFSGSTSAPTLSTGTFTADTDVIVSSAAYDEGDATLTATATPEPSTLIPLAAGILALAGRRFLYPRRK
jgi:hypothetical protein